MPMGQKGNEPTWPLLCILLSLFVLSATSPSLWERAARRRASQSAADKPQVAILPQETPPSATAAGGSETETRGLGGSEIPAVPVAPASEETCPAVDTAPPTVRPFSVPAVSEAGQAAVTLASVPAAAPAAPASQPESAASPASAAPPEMASPPELTPPPSDPPAVAASALESSAPVDPPPDTTAVANRPMKLTTPARDVETLRSLLLPTEPLTAEAPVAADKPATRNQPASDKPDAVADHPAGTSSRGSETDHEKQPAPRNAAGDPPPANDRAPSVAESLWPKPEALFAQLAGLLHEPETRDWASEVDKLVRKLGPAMADGTPEALPLAARLERLSEQGRQLAVDLGTRPAAASVRQAVYALDRRLAVWKPIVRAGGLKSDPKESGTVDLGRLAASMAEVGELLAGSPDGPGWRRFLELDLLGKLADTPAGSQNVQTRELARKVLDRIARTSLKAQQRRFLAEGPMGTLCRELKRLASGPVPFVEVARHIEQYEQEGTLADARLLAQDCQQLLFSAASQKQAIGQELEGYYRNANVRLVATVELLNRFIPERPKEYGDVSDVVLGKPVYGRSLTATRVSLRLIPDPQNIHVAFDVNGVVAASTHSVAGPATFYSDSQSVYRGWKEIEIGREGIHLHPARVAVNNDLTLRGLQTDFDELPLIGALAQEVARSQHEQKRCEMISEVEQKIASRAQWQIDQEAEARLGTAAQRVRSAVLDPMAELSLGPSVVSAETTDRRVTVRLRLASDRQLGSHTPRPQAPADSAVSLQIHESAINNVFEQLGLDGATFTLPQLRERISSRLGRSDLFSGGTENDDVTIRFAPRNALHVACRDGQVILTLAIRQLAKLPYAWDDFQVRVFLRPRVQGRTVELVRDEVIHLIGENLNTRSQIALRGVFGKTFHKQRPISLIPDRIVNEPRLQDLVFTQVVVEDGWIGAALGAGRVARKLTPPAENATRSE